MVAFVESKGPENPLQLMHQLQLRLRLQSRLHQLHQLHQLQAAPECRVQSADCSAGKQAVGGFAGFADSRTRGLVDAWALVDSSWAH